MNQPFQQGRASYLKRTATVSAGGVPFVINQSCRFFAVLNVTGSVRISFDNDEATDIAGGIQIKAEDGRVFNTITFFSDAGATVEYALAYGEIFDSRLTVSGSINLTAGQSIITYSGSAITHNQRTIGTSSTTIDASDTTRRAITIKADPANIEPVFIGSVPTLATGFRLDPGESMTLNTTAGLAGICATGGQIVYYMKERT
jgi:hypothetical protein